jgi:thiol-disulfide isomerase/thioredoxin
VGKTRRYPQNQDFFLIKFERLRRGVNMSRRTCAEAFLFMVFCASLAFAQQNALDLDGRSVDPWQNGPPKVVVLLFVRTDCTVSNRYAPTIQKLSAAYAGKAEFYLVYPDRAESPAAIRTYLQEYGYKLPALRDLNHTLVKRSAAQFTPEAAVFDGSARLTYHGRIDDLFYAFGRARSTPTTHELEDAIRATLAGRAPAVSTASAVGCYISDLE